MTKEYYFPTHQQAHKFRIEQEKKGNTVEVIPRLRVGTVIYCVKIIEGNDGHRKQPDDAGREQACPQK